jgi:hypothetical protein
MQKMSSSLFEDYVDLALFADNVDRDPRTVRRWMRGPNGLPYTRIGNRILIHIPTARDWIFRRMRRPNPSHQQRHARCKLISAAPQAT